MSLQLNFLTDYFFRFSCEPKSLTRELWPYVQEKNGAVPIAKQPVISYIKISIKIRALW